MHNGKLLSSPTVPPRGDILGIGAFEQDAGCRGQGAGGRGQGDKGQGAGGRGQGDRGDYYPLPITHYPLPITHYPLPFPIDAYISPPSRA
jgi:hypothetical protein